MKTKFALILLLGASLAACSTTVKTTQSPYDKNARYAENSVGAPGAFESDIPAEGPAPGNIADSPAYIPTPLLRQSAAGSP